MAGRCPPTGEPEPFALGSARLVQDRLERTAPFRNLSADFLVAAIRLDFDMTAPGRFTTADLFPADSVDPMFASFERHLFGAARHDLTDFA